MKKNIPVIIAVLVILLIVFSLTGLKAFNKKSIRVNPAASLPGSSLIDDSSALYAIDTSKVIFDSVDLVVFQKLMDTIGANGKDTLPVNEIAVWLGKYFMGCTYSSNIVPPKTEKKIVVNLRNFDCVTLVETVTALAFCIKNKQNTPVGFLSELEKNRYRNGQLGDYPIRLHYFTEWIYDNSKRGTVTDITAELDSIPYEKTINFMTSNRAKYHRLKDNDDFYKAMLIVEKEMNKHQLYYIPKDKIATVENNIHEGDIIAFTTSVVGLDVSHVGFAVWQEGVLHLMHASSQSGKVIISEKALKDYTAGVKSQTGIIVARMNPR